MAFNVGLLPRLRNPVKNVIALKSKTSAGMVIQGWDEGLANLRIGDHATLIIPPSLGYGAGGAGNVIPPNATLIFIIEVLGVK